MPDPTPPTIDPNPPAPPAPDPPAAPPAPAADWLSGISDPALKDSPSLKKFKDVPTLAQSYVALEKEMGGRVKLPTDGDEKAATEFWEKVGVPNAPEGYKIAPPTYPEGFPDEYKITGEDLKEFSAVFHKLRIPARAAAGLIEVMVQRSVEAASSEVSGRHEREMQYLETMKTEWGVTFERNTNLADRVFKTFADDNFTQLVQDRGWHLEPGFARFMAKIGHALGEKELLVGEPVSTANPASLKAELAAIENNPKYWKADSLADRAEHDRLVARKSEIYQLLYSTP